MIATSWIVAVGLAFAALHIGSAETTRRARVRGMVWIAGLAAAAVAGEWFGPGMSTVERAIVLADLLIAWLAVGFAAAASHTPRALGRAVGIVATSIAGIAAGAVGILVALGVTAWMARSAADGKPGRAFDRAQVFALVAAGSGVLAGSMGAGDWSAAAILCAALVRAGIVPSHGWLTELVERLPRAVGVAFLAPTLCFWPILLDACSASMNGIAVGVAIFAMLSALAGALGSLVQSDARRALTWLWSAQSALVLYALALDGVAGHEASVLLAAVLSVSMAGAWSVMGAVEARRGQLHLEGGGSAGAPRAAAAFLVLGMAGVGMPATPGFVAEDLVLHASSGLGLWAGAGLLLAAAVQGIALMRIYFGVFAGARRQPSEPDLVLRERVCASVALALLLIGGVWPRAFVGGMAAAPVASSDGGR
jgi:NADH-quinone oxidoreductase subunit M